MSRRGFKAVKKTKVSVRTYIENKPKNINKNKLINIDPDFTEASAYYGGFGGTV
ncbi:hypothetical protein [Paenibacillus antarcticus]|uniref:hypothetical protein n=1 Tax=Paenibacillus antarcticus TaxID=253703 RepID=UPI000AF29AA1|nr:hypothetical protein [Paenibacillus antarcticus]